MASGGSSDQETLVALAAIPIFLFFETWLTDFELALNSRVTEASLSNFLVPFKRNSQTLKKSSKLNIVPTLGEAS